MNKRKGSGGVVLDYCMNYVEVLGLWSLVAMVGGVGV